ncbi:MAG TPA: glycosyltransferase family 2 protein [Anaerolineaceae bacterium]
MSELTGLSIIIVSWNTRELLRRCLASIYENPPARPFETWVVDNGSQDGSAQMVRDLFPRVRLIENQSNAGFAAANNQVFPLCTGEYVLLLNPDTVVLPGAVDGLLSYLDSHPEAGAVGPRLVSADGADQLSVFPFPTLSRELWRLFHLDRVAPYALYDPRRWDTSAPHEVDSIQGACLMVRRQAVPPPGLFDPDYFLYSEEIDLCFRLRRAGWKLDWIPAAAVVHLGGQSSRQEVKKSFLNLYRGKILFFRKHYGRAQAFGYRCVLAVSALVRIALSPVAWLEPAARREDLLTRAGNYLALLGVIWNL